MNSFVIGTTEFGIDVEKSSLQTRHDQHHVLMFSLTIVGDPSVFEELSRSDISPWNWALYPPQIYIHGLFCQSDLDHENWVCRLPESQSGDTGLYMMEHSEIKSATLSFKAGKYVSCEGMLSLWGDDKSFSFSFEKFN